MDGLHQTCMLGDHIIRSNQQLLFSRTRMRKHAAVLRDDAIRGRTMGATYDPLNLEGEYIEMFGGRARLGAEYIRTAFNLPIYETAAHYKGALCVIHGTGDRTVPYTYGSRYAQQSPNAERNILHGEDHGFMKDMERATDIAVEFITRQVK